MDKRKNVSVLNGVRVIAVNLVFVEHLCFQYITSDVVMLLAISVYICFNVSGFLAFYNGDQYDDNITIKRLLNDSMKIYLHKLKRFYFVHAFVLLLIVIWNNGYVLQFVFDRYNSLRLLAHVFLFQSLVPVNGIYFEFNGVSWYLSTLIILSFCAPWLIVLIKKALSKISPFTFAFIVGIAKWSFIVLAFLFDVDTRWLFYVNPLIKSFDFVNGMLIAYLYKKEYHFKISDLNKKNRVIMIVTYIMFAICMSLMFPEYFVYFLGSDIAFVFMCFLCLCESSVRHFFELKFWGILSLYCFEFFMIHEFIIRLLVYYFGISKFNFGISFLIALPLSQLAAFIVKTIVSFWGEFENSKLIKLL